ncbi:MAG: LapA family protein, partial [Gammaproteobacteria bacterium]|nr:LapA family protein [Gammaproteobacteria bacterium]
WIIFSFAFGALSGLILGAGLVRHLQLRYRIRQLEQELAQRPRFSRTERD